MNPAESAITPDLITRLMEKVERNKQIKAEVTKRLEAVMKVGDKE
jgi:hypothetical protein